MTVTVEATGPSAQLANVELRQLRYFLAVAEELSFRRAAGRLYVTQPTVSRQVVQLEHQLGARLFERDKRGVRLTPAGSILLERASAAVAMLERSLADARSAAQPARATLRVGYVLRDAASVTPLLDAFRVQRADVWLQDRQLSTPDQVDALWRRQLDVGFVRGTVDGRFTTMRIRLAPRALGVALPRRHALTRSERVPLGALAGQCLLMPSRLAQPGHWCRVIALCRAAGFEPEIVECDGVDDATGAALIPMVAAGRGVCLLTCAVPRRAAAVVVRAVEPPLVRVDLTLAWRAGDRSPLVEAFTDMAAGTAPRPNQGRR
jgi:DNA-binding transcriptional LysR family regulator